MTLPVTLDHHDLEAPIDLVARLAVANGFPSLREFLDHSDTSARAIVAGDAEALDLVSQWSGVPAARLARWAITGNGDRATWSMGCATLSKDMRAGRRMRFCAKCVLEDREREQGRLSARAWRRAWWNVRGIESCHVHGCGITEVAVDGDVDLHDLPHFVNANFRMIEEAANNAQPGRQRSLDRFLVDRIVGVEGEGLLHGLDAHVAAEFSRYLGDFLKLHGLGDFLNDEDDVAEAGFKLAIQGPKQVRRVLADVIDRDRPMTRYVERLLGPMITWFRRNIDKAAYQSLIDLVQGIMERNMPFGEGQVIIRPVRERHVYCVNSAHAEFGIPKDRIRALMKANDPDFRDGLLDSSTYFDAEAFRPLINEVAETLTSTEAATELGVTDERVLNLLKEGILEQVETRDGDERPYARIRRAAVADLIHRFSEKLAPVVEEEGLLSLRKATASYRRPFCDIVSMILDGSIQGFILPGTAPVFRRMRIGPYVPQTPSGPLSGGNDKLMRLKEAEIALGTTTSTINDLVERGYLRERRIKRASGQTVRFIERQSFVEFDEAHVSLSAITKARKGYRVTVKAEIDALGIEPVFEPIGFNARFYRREDLTQYW